MVDRFLNGLRKFTFLENETSEDVQGLLAEGRVEQLVREGRTPLKIAQIGGGKYSDMHPFYQVPPKGFDPAYIKKVFESMGVYVFENFLGVKKIGSTFTLTDEQSKEVDDRVKAELKKIGKK